MMIPETIDAARSGDTGAFALIVEQYRQSVFRICIRILGDSDEAEDAVQETFVRAWQSLKGYDPHYSIATWLRTIACRLCYDVLRRRTRRRQYEQDACRQGSMDSGNPESLRMSRELESLFRKAASGLSPMQRTVFVLAEIEQLPSDEVRRITGWSAAQIKSNLYIARKKVRKTIEEEL
ncbi:MAG TPA: RNA polymerase sigma factor [Candidatus Coprenecus stercoravium]|uniref:RNA polymerase sigma factor n=1 Tax=Candidatus Coprenecus stercoravium TaxID=2840735 RepID=A0A9D2GNH5_9BACT|nr:RNA polymerase sigma factor [Candidatus Coprenecus stercoravium]